MHSKITMPYHNLPWFWVLMCGWSPRTPPHSYTRLSEKHDPFIYFLSEKDTPFVYYLLDFTYSYPFSEKIPHLIYFWGDNDTHSYTWGLKSIPHSSRTSVYTFIMEVTPPPLWVETNNLTRTCCEIFYTGIECNVWRIYSNNYALSIVTDDLFADYRWTPLLLWEYHFINERSHVI